MKPALIRLTLDDEKANRVARSHHDAISAIQSSPAGSLKRFTVPLAVGGTVSIQHGLGREPVWVGISAPRGTALTAGLVSEVAGADRTKQVTLTATGFGAAIVVDVLVA